MFFMIPYFETGPLFTVPLINKEVHLFGLLVVTGIVVGVNVSYWKAKQIRVNKERLSSLITFMLVTAFITAHLFDNLAYRFHEVLENPLMLLNFWSGISSFGGFMGALLGTWYYTRRHNLNFLEYTEPIAFGLPFGWFFGRLGCASVHDHIGAKTDFFLGVNFPPPLGVRHDLGLDEAIFTFFLSLLFIALRNKGKVRGYYMMLLCLLYAPIRFLFDSLRATDISGADVRFLGLTPAQYSSIALFLAGLYLYNRIYNKGKPVHKNEDQNIPG
jgi:phosphatidylglycerol:prolipoprotein diacylglycerol transferase